MKEEILPWWFCECLPLSVSHLLQVNHSKLNTQCTQLPLCPSLCIPINVAAPLHPRDPPLVIYTNPLPQIPPRQVILVKSILFSSPLPPPLFGHPVVSSLHPQYTQPTHSPHILGNLLEHKSDQIPALPSILTRLPLPEG